MNLQLERDQPNGWMNSLGTRLTEKKPVHTIKDKVVDVNYTFEMQQTFPDKHIGLWVCSSQALYVVCR